MTFRLVGGPKDGTTGTYPCGAYRIVYPKLAVYTVKSANENEVVLHYTGKDE